MPQIQSAPVTAPAVETEVTTVYPSIAATGLGRLIGALCNWLKLGNLNVSAILFGLPLAPLAALAYLLQKAFGQRYVLTNQAVKKWSAMGDRLDGEALLTQIASVEVVQQGGQAFYHAADLHLLDAGGNVLVVLPGVPRADVFRNLILEARDARTQVQAALATIAARSR